MTLWNNDMKKVAKQRTYVTFKKDYICEALYKMQFRDIKQIVLRCGILPLRVETGRYFGQNC